MDKKKSISIFIFILTSILVLVSCIEKITDPDNSDNDSTETKLVQKVGSDASFEIMTWNIENFPLSGATTVNNVKTIIRNLDVDFIAVQEIGSISSFNTLLDSLAGWNGALSSDSYGTWYQKTGFIYKSEFISISNVKNIFDGPDDWYAFPRPPLTGYVEIKDAGGTKFNFHIIVLHLKASGGDDNEARREAACEDLKVYIDAEIAAGADPDFMVLGDWNDEITDSADRNVFNSFLDNPAQYSFLTSGMSGKYSYISTTYRSLIDHILISENIKQAYGNGNTDVLYLDSEFRKYPSEVSDHRPVVAIFDGFMIE